MLLLLLLWTRATTGSPTSPGPEVIHAIVVVVVVVDEGNYRVTTANQAVRTRSVSLTECVLALILKARLPQLHPHYIYIIYIYVSAGEIVLGGGNVALGYYKLPDKTKEDFYTDDAGTRWFRTGDVGEFYEDGTLKIIGK